MLIFPNKSGIDGLCKSEQSPAFNAAVQRTPAATKLSAAKLFLAEIGGARPGVLNRFLSERGKA